MGTKSNIPSVNEPRVQALAESMVVHDAPHKYDGFMSGKAGHDDGGGYFVGYCNDAVAVLESLERRGFTIVPIRAMGLNHGESNG